MPQVDKDISTLGTNPEMTRAYLRYFELDQFQGGSKTLSVQEMRYFKDRVFDLKILIFFKVEDP